MKLEQLEMLDAVVKAGSFARAANELLLISQPAVSAGIRKLEESLGFALFDRETYRPTLTPRGQAFYARAQALLADTSALSHYARLLADGVEPALSIASEPFALLPAMLKVFREQTGCFAQTRFEFLDEPVGGGVARLMDEEADLALVNWQGAPYRALPLEQRRLFSFTICPMIAPDHPLAQGDEALAPEDLTGSVQIVSRSNDRYLPSGGFGLQSHARFWHVNDHLTKQQLIVAGLGFGMLPHHIVAAELAAGSLIPFTRLPGFAIYDTGMHMVRRKDRPHGPVAEGLWKALAAAGALSP